MTGVPRQHCKVHFMRNVMAHVASRFKEVAGVVKAIFLQTSTELAMAQTRSVAKYKKNCSRAMQILGDGIEDALAPLGIGFLNTGDLFKDSWGDKMRCRLARQGPW